jgi:hypothetical protein
MALRAVLTAAWIATGSVSEVLAGPPAPPGGRHGVYYGGDNTTAYPPLTLTDAGDDAGAGLATWQVRTAPNPFRESTQIQFGVRRGDNVHVELYSTTGRLVREFQETSGQTGWHAVTWDGRDRSGKPLPAGVYFYRVTTGARTATGRLVFIR